MSDTQMGRAINMPLNADNIPIMRAVSDVTEVISRPWAPLVRWPIGEDGIPKIAIINMGSQPEIPVVEQSVKAVAAMPINGHRFVAFENDQLVLADHVHPNVLGMIVHAVMTNEEIEVITAGMVSNPGWNFVQDRPILLGTDGRPAQSVTDSMQFILSVGIPTSPHAMSIRIGLPTYL